MELTVLLLSDRVESVVDLLPDFPFGPYRLSSAALKGTEGRDLLSLHPDLLLVDATGDLAAAQDATRRFSLAWDRTVKRGLRTSIQGRSSARVTAAMGSSRQARAVGRSVRMG